VYYIVANPFAANNWGHALAQFPILCQFLTASSMLVEFFAPLLVVLTPLTSNLRMFAILSLIGLHAGNLERPSTCIVPLPSLHRMLDVYLTGIGVHLNLVNWPLTASASLIMFAPCSMWDAITAFQRRIVGVPDTVVVELVVHGSHVAVKSAAVAVNTSTAIVKLLLGLFGLSVANLTVSEGSSQLIVNANGIGVSGAKAVKILEQLSTRAGWYHRLSLRYLSRVYPTMQAMECKECTSRTFKMLPQVLPVLMTSYLLATCAGDVFPSQFPKFDGGDIGEALRFDQYWLMFAPSPPKTGEWFIVAGTTVSGKTVDWLAGYKSQEWMTVDNETMLLQMPPVISDLYRSFRWERWLFKSARMPHRLHTLARYACETSGIPLANASVFRVDVNVEPPGHAPQYSVTYPMRDVNRTAPPTVLAELWSVATARC
jgi:hypothetical protein